MFTHPSGAPGDLGRAFLVGIILNVAFVAPEAVYGVFAHSTALLADAAHNHRGRRPGLDGEAAFGPADFTRMKSTACFSRLHKTAARI